MGKPISRSIQRALPVLLVAPFLFAGKCKSPPPDPDPVPPPVQDIGQKLSVVSIDPSVEVANKSFTARVYGSGFKEGASLRVGNVDGEKVKVNDENGMVAVVPALPVGSYDVIVTNANGESSTLRGGLTIKSGVDECRKVTVYFDYDQDALTGSTKSTLNGKMSCYQQASGAIKVEGHADERGTIDYNVALGQRRADQVKRYLSTNGISSSRLSTISYGEERPAASGHNESAWSKNRRAELHAFE